MPRLAFDHPVLRAAARWRDRCLLDEGSVFTEKRLWTAENVEHLAKQPRARENSSKTKGNFFERLENDLIATPRTAKQLAAEMFWVMYLFPVPSSMQPGTKRQQIRRIWEWSGEPLPDAPFELYEALNDGIGSPGPAFNTQRWREFLFLIRVMEAWTRLSRSVRETKLGDSWAFANWLEQQDETESRQIRHIILYLLFPNDFEPFATVSQKEIIVSAFAKELGEAPPSFDDKHRIAVDRQILAIRRKLQERRAAPDFDFHDEPYLRIWRPDAPEPENGHPPRVNVRAGRGGHWVGVEGAHDGCGRGA